MLGWSSNVASPVSPKRESHSYSTSASSSVSVNVTSVMAQIPVCVGRSASGSNGVPNAIAFSGGTSNGSE